MSLDVSTALLESAERGEVDDAAFVDCVRTSLPSAWQTISGVVDERRATPADLGVMVDIFSGFARQNTHHNSKIGGSGAAGRSAGAAAAGTEDLQRMAHVDETVFIGDPVGPALHGGAEHLLGAPARAAHQVMVVPVAAPAVTRVAARRLHHVDLAGLGQQLQCAIDSGQPDTVALRA